MDTIGSALLAFSLMVAVFTYVQFWSNSKKLPLPPGPPRGWIGGHLFVLPKTNPWLSLGNWNEKYGDLIFLDLPTRPLLCIGSVKAADDLLVRKSHIYSSRLNSVMINLINWDWALAALPYGQKLRVHRRHFHEHFSMTVIPKYHGIQLEETRRSLLRVLNHPSEAREQIRRLPGAVIIRVTYGVSDTEKVKEYVQLAVKAMESARAINRPGAFVAEFFQFLQYFPTWAPGGGARKYGDFYRPIVHAMRDVPFDGVKEAIAQGNAQPSISYDLIRKLQGEDAELKPEFDKLAREVAGVAFAGGADTIIASTEAFAVAIAMFPEAQRKAQEELDRVIGQSRLPEFQDLENLPYVKAVIMESLRWMPAVPLGIPHFLTEEDEYRGYRIPKDSIVVYNLRLMMHNPEDYPEPELFKPERFLGKDGKIDPSVRDPTSIAFGFGRRACPGADFAMSVISVYIASTLHVFEILPGFDERGRPVVLTEEFTDEAVISPLSFPRHFKPRSQQLERLVRDLVPPEDEDSLSSSF